MWPQPFDLPRCYLSGCTSPSREYLECYCFSLLENTFNYPTWVIRSRSCGAKESWGSWCSTEIVNRVVTGYMTSWGLWLLFRRSHLGWDHDQRNKKATLWDWPQPILMYVLYPDQTWYRYMYTWNKDETKHGSYPQDLYIYSIKA